MTSNRLRAVIYGCLPLLASTAVAVPFVPGPSTIVVTDRGITCVGRTPVLDVALSINGSDMGRPGLVYVGAHDAQQTEASFLGQDRYWQPLVGVAFPPAVIRRDGLVSQQIRIPLRDVAGYQGGSLYVGYGALSVGAEAMVRQAVASVATAKARWPDRQIPSVDEDYYKRTLIQEDMRKQNKYSFVRYITPDLTTMCEPQGGN